MIRILEHRIGDSRVIRLIDKWLKAGFMEDGAVTATEEGTPQGAVISSLMANILSVIISLNLRLLCHSVFCGAVFWLATVLRVVAGLMRSKSSKDKIVSGPSFV
jgi:retron-type reverse transcriptase